MSFQPVLIQSTNFPVRTLIEQSTVDHPITLQSSGQIVSQILTTTQGSPTRKSNTFVYRSESPIRSSQYGRNVVNVSTIQRQDAPIFISKSTTQNPIYVEKIVKVESSNTQELSILRQRITVLEQNNRTLTEELIELRGATPQQVEQIVYIQDNEEMERLQNEHEGVKRSKKDADDNNNRLLQEINRLNQVIRELTIKVTEFQQILPSRDAQIKALQAQNEALSIRVVLTTAELERLVRERVEIVPLQKKISDLENYVNVQERTIEDLRNKLLQQDQVINQLRLFEVRCGQQEQEINGLKARIEELLRVIQQLQTTINQKDQEIGKLTLQINQLNISVMQGQNYGQELEALKQAYAQRVQEIEELRRRCQEYDMLVIRIQQLEARLKEAEQNNLLLIKKIEELQGNLNEEAVKRSKNKGDLDSSLRDKQLLEEKLVHFTQQIEFMSRKISAYEEEIGKLRARIQELEGIARQVDGLQLTIQSLNQQIERLNQIVADKDGQINKLFLEINQLRVQAAQVPVLQEKNAKLLEVIVVRTAEIEELRTRLVELEQAVAQIPGLQARLKEYENIINMLRQRIAELEGALNDEGVKRSKREGELSLNLRDKQALEEKLVHLTQQIEFLSQKCANYEKQLGERDQIIIQLRQEISQFQLTIMQLQSGIEQLKQTISILEQKLQECENNNGLLRQRIAELEGALNDEGVKRSKREGELNLNLRDKQALEEKLVHLTQQIEFLSQKCSNYERQLGERDQIIIQLRQEISQFQLTIMQLQSVNEQLKQAIALLEQKLQECENNNALLRQRIAELEGALNDENVKRSRKEGELTMNLREKQALEEKLVHLTQQIEFLSRKLTIVEQENLQLRAVVVSASQILEAWAKVQTHHSQFTVSLEGLLVELKKVQQFSSVSTKIVTVSSQSVSSSQYVQRA